MHSTRNSLGAPVARGAAVWTTLGAVAPLLLAAEGVLRRDASHILVALALLACFAAGGAMGGLLYGATARLRESGYRGLSWALVGGAVTLTTILAARLVAHTVALSEIEGDRITALTDGPAIIRIAMAGALFGALWGRTIRKEDRTPLMVGLSDDVGSGWLLVWLGVAAITSFGFLLEDKHVPIPETPEDARRIFASAEREARARPRDARSQFAFALSLMRLGNLDQAIPALQRVLQLNPRNAYAHDALGWSLNRQRKFAEAVPHLEEALRIDPRYADALHNLGVANSGLGQFQAAEVSLREAARLNSHEPSIAADYAYALYKRGNKPLALQYLLRASRLAPDVVAYHGYAGDLLRELGRYPESVAQFREVTRLQPQFFGGWTALGISEYLAGDPVGAATALNEGRRLNPQYFEANPWERTMLRHAQEGRTDAVPKVPPASRVAPDSSRAGGR